MSRVHEALKRAEREQASTQQSPHQPAADPLLLDQPTVAESPAEPAGQEAPSASSPFSVEMLSARCPQREWKPDLHTMLFMNGTDNAKGMAEYRTLRARLYQMREKMPLKRLLVASALPKDGKSFTAANLAQVLVRQQGQRVLLVDADLRGPTLHRMLGTGQAPGLYEYLRGSNDEFSVMHRGQMGNLFFIPSGTGSEDPGDLLVNGRLGTLLQRVETLFDWIILDSPPAVPVTDASVLAKTCDGVLMVVRSNLTPADAARKARMEFPDQALVGVVLNGAAPDGMPYRQRDGYPAK